MTDTLQLYKERMLLNKSIEVSTMKSVAMEVLLEEDSPAKKVETQLQLYNEERDKIKEYIDKLVHTEDITIEDAKKSYGILDAVVAIDNEVSNLLTGKVEGVNTIAELNDRINKARSKLVETYIYRIKVDSKDV